MIYQQRKLIIGSLLTLLWMFWSAAIGAQEGQFFRGEERSRIIEETQSLAAIQARNEDEIMKLPGVLGMGVGLDRESRKLAFLVVVDKKAEMPKLPKDIEGVPILVERHEPDITLDGAPNCNQPCHADQQALPVEMGNSAFTVNRCSACTMGFKACDPDTQQTVYVTNAHCQTDANGCVGAAPPGTNTSHVARQDANPVCSIASIVGQTLQQVSPNCNANNNTLDCASVTSTDDQTQMSIRDIGVPSAFPGTVVVGDTVQKSGRTTGYTQGTVASTNFTINVSGYGCCGNGGVARFIGQIRVNAIGNGPFIMGGDSGSALLNMNNEIVGLLHSGPATGLAGNANQIDDVLNALGVTLDPVPCIQCAAQTAAEKTSDSEGTLDVLYGVRDGVLSKSEKGQGYIALFYEFSSDVVGLMARNPKLLGRTATLLTENLETLSGLVKEGKATMASENIEEISQLLRSYAEIADDDLRQALERLDEDLKNAELLAEFGLQVR